MEFSLDIDVAAANLPRMGPNESGKQDQPAVVTVTPDRLEIRAPLAERLRAAAQQTSARLGCRVTPEQYALAVLAQALAHADVERQVPLTYWRE